MVVAEQRAKPSSERDWRVKHARLDIGLERAPAVSVRVPERQLPGLKRVDVDVHVGQKESAKIPRNDVAGEEDLAIKEDDFSEENQVGNESQCSQNKSK